MRGGIGRITAFDGSAWLQPRDILLQGRLSAAPIGSTVTLWWDADPPDPFWLGKLWIPPTATTLWPHSAIAPYEPLVSNPNAVAVPPDGTDRFHSPDIQARSALGTPSVAPPTPLRDFLIPAADPEMKDGKDLQFLFVIDDGAGNLLPVARLTDPTDPRSARPWMFKVRELRMQRGEVTIMSNVINPLRGETTKLHYVLSEAGYVTIIVFDLKGDIVNVLVRGRQVQGEYSTTWDGRNRGGRIVARGIYFIRVVGPGFNEMRKVMVVK
jgi:hypothetical protein